MNCAADRKSLGAGTASGISIVGLALLPKCPLCLAMWLSLIGISGIQGGHLEALLFGLLLLVFATAGIKLISAQRSSFMALLMALLASYAIRRYSTDLLFSLVASVGASLMIFSAWYLLRARRHSNGCHRKDAVAHARVPSR